MPRFPLYLTDESSAGRLEVIQSSVDKVEVDYIPSQERLDAVWPNRPGLNNIRAQLLVLDVNNPSVTISPINTRVEQGIFWGNKYPQVERITIADAIYIGTDLTKLTPTDEDEVMMLLEDLPACFLKDYDSGLGFGHPIR